MWVVVMILRLKNVGKYFPIRGGLLSRVVGYVKAVDGVDLEVEEGDTYAIVGESGSGKTTLGKLSIKLLDPTFGSIEFMGRDVTFAKGKELKDLRRSTGIVFQDPYRSLHPRKKIIDIVSEPLIINGQDPEEAHKIAVEFASMVGLTKDLLYKYPHQLSGGQRQRAAIVRALIYRPRLIVLDEPTSALDVSTQAQILNLLEDLKKEFKLTYILITHNLQIVYHLANKVAVMYLGKIVEKGPVEKIFESPRHPYTISLLSSIPAIDYVFSGGKINIPRITPTGEPPSPTKPPKGCRFHTRCPFVIDICRREEPTLQPVEKDHYVACHLWQKINA
jgi:oligopeptide/dipeptide ABC transporter ATP-binding protein